MNTIIIIFSIIIVQITPLFLRYMPFSSLINIKKKQKLFISYFIGFILEIIILYIIIGFNKYLITPLVYKRIIFFSSFIFIAINIIIIKGYIFKHLFIYAMTGGYSLFIHSITSVTLSLFRNGHPLPIQFLMQSTVYVTLFILVTALLWKYISNSIIFQRTITQEYYWNAIWLIPALSVCSNSIISMNDNWINTWPQIVSRILTAITLIVSWVCVTNDFKSLENMQLLKNTNKLLYMQKESILNQAEIISDNDKKLRILKHDMRHHLQILLSLIENKNYNESIALISEILSTMHSTKPITYCTNTVINAALLVYITRAKEENIEVICKVNIPNTIPWNSNDIAILFANTLENAVIASTKEEDNTRRIEILTTYEDNKLAILIKNKFNKEIIFDKTGMPITNEADHGIGTQSILSIVNKYNGFVSCSQENGWFSMSFLFD